MTTLERLAVALPLVLSAACTFAIARRRIVFLLGRQGPLLAPAFCVLVWLAGLSLAQAAGTLVAMSIGGALPLLALALLALRFAPVRRRAPGVTRVAGAAVLLAIALYLLVVIGFDSLCHFAIVGNYLRGNIPPTALNDPASPLPYHPLFDAAAAVVTRAFATDLELGLDLVSLLAVLAALLSAAALARGLFPGGSRAWQPAVLCLLLGFGPTQLRPHAGPLAERLHGQTTQAFLDQMLRRPFPLSFAVVCLVLALLVSTAGSRARRPALAGLLLAVPFFLLPQVAEEQVLVLGLLVAGLLVLRRLPPLTVAIAGAATVAGGLLSGVLRALLEPASMASPKLALLWPPLVPTWAAPLSGWPLASAGALEVAAFELGPLFFAALALLAVRRSFAHRMVLAVVLANLIAATCLTLRGWPRADLDRFVFQAANLGLLATPAVLLAILRLRPWRASRALRAATVGLAVLLLAGGSVPLALHRVAAGGFRPLGPERPYGQLRRVLSRVVGPRDLVATDAASAQMLVTAGFLVVAPMDSHMVGIVNGARFRQHAGEHRCRARWSWLPELDPAVRAAAPALFHGGYALLPTPGCERVGPVGP